MKHKCHACREDLIEGAKICKHCGSFQDWRRHMMFSSSILALLVALVSVTSFTIPIIKKSLIVEDSNILLSFQFSRENEICIIATNNGSKSGSIANSELIIRKNQKNIGKYPLRISGESSGEAFISPGISKQLKLYIINEERNRIEKEDIDLLSCMLDITSIKYSGEEDNKHIPLNCHKLGRFMRNEIFIGE